MANKTITFGTQARYLLLGGGPLLVACAHLLKAAGKSFSVLTSERHLKEVVGDVRFEELLTKEGWQYKASYDVNVDSDVLALIGPTTVGISMGAAWILKAPFIDRFGGKLINMHGSLLPLDRGAGGFSWRIMVGDRRGCALMHQIEPGLDTGGILMRQEYEFTASCVVPGDYITYSVARYEALFTEFLRRSATGETFELLTQDERASTYWPRLATDLHGFADWSWSAEEIVRFIAAFDEPYPGASTYLGATRVRIRVARFEAGDFHPFQAGLIYRIDADGVRVAARGGSVVLRSVSDESGEAAKLGHRLHTPQADLERARQYRARYTPHGLKE